MIVNHRQGVSAAALIFAATAGAAAAQPATGGGTQVETVVVTAQKRSQNIQEVPISIQAFSGQQLKSLGIKSSVDIGQFTPNVDISLVAGPGNQPIISIRGIGLNDYDTNNAGPNGVYVDEVYLSAPASQSFSTFDLDRVEVLKGPQGTLYGRNTSGGAIDFITRKPTDVFTGDLHFEASSYNTLQAEGGVGGPIAKDLSGRFSFVYNSSSGYGFNTVNGGRTNGFNNYALRTQLLWKPTDTLKVLFNVHGGQVDNLPTEYRHIGDLSPTTGLQCSVAETYAGGCVDLFGYGTPKGFYDGAYNRTQHLRVNSLGSSLRIDDRIGSITLTSISAFEHNDKLHPEDTDASPNRLLEINFGVKSNTFTQELRASQSEKRFNWVAGLYFLTEKLQQNQPLFLLLDGDTFFGGPGAADGIAFRAFDRSNQITNAYAVYGQGDYALTNRLKLTLGGRYTNEQRGFDYNSSVQFQQGGMDNFGPVQPLVNTHEGLRSSAFNWRVALDYHVTDDVLVYASAATGFKSGDFNGSFLSLVPEEIQRQLVPVKPEHVTAFEVGAKTSFFDHRLLFDIAGFYNVYNDLQIFTLVNPPPGDPEGSLPINVLDNAKRAHTEGIEVEMVAKPIPTLTLSVNAGLLETRLDDYVTERAPGTPDYSGNQLPDSPRFSMSAIVDKTFPTHYGVWDLQFSANYKSHQYFDSSNDPYITQDGYWIENLRLGFKPEGTRWEFAGFVRNLAETHYYLDKFDLTSPFGFIQGIIGAPRFIGMEANYRW